MSKMVQKEYEYNATDCSAKDLICGGFFVVVVVLLQKKVILIIPQNIEEF